ncbi:MAG: hypothetical protein EA340_04480 [Nitriliruptor sp.]|nr:MAG: hypothetical protein EA340_04480 [Nitriliruptor sp.]
MAVEAGRAGDRPWWALVVSVTGFTVAVWLVVGPLAQVDASGHDGPQMLQVAPGGQAELASLPSEHQVLYEAAAADREAFTQVRCYCGCEDFLAHRHLLDCFEQPEGGWELHATGCAVCLAEAEEVAEQRAAGTPMDEIVRRIDNRYGQITADL